MRAPKLMGTMTSAVDEGDGCGLVSMSSNGVDVGEGAGGSEDAGFGTDGADVTAGMLGEVLRAQARFEDDVVLDSLGAGE